jgi:ceramide glucosyltransferase
MEGNEVLEILLLLLLIASLLFWVVATLLVYRFFGRRREPDLENSENSRSSFTPPVSILKPVSGVDAQAYENFLSFCQQDYPSYEVLFAVDDPTDAVILIINRLQRQMSGVNIRLMVVEPGGPNHKASLLDHLANQARYDYFVVSDSDMRVTKDYLRRVIAPLADEEIGMVTCAYRGDDAQTFTARLETLHMGVTFLPSVVVARKFLDMRFAMGATMAMRREDIVQIGGFNSVIDYLADDYEIAIRIVQLGRRIVLSDYIVVDTLGSTSFQEQIDREVRWARCNRANRPLEYPGLLITFSTTFALSLLLVSRFAAYAWWMLLLALFLRWMTAWVIAEWTEDHESQRWIIWTPLRDLLSTYVWFLGAYSRRVTWRDEEFVVDHEGRMVALPRSEQTVDLNLK